MSFSLITIASKEYNTKVVNLAVNLNTQGKWPAYTNVHLSKPEAKYLINTYINAKK